jgi:hypothetical protein
MKQNNTKILDEIFKSQRPYSDRSELRYNHMQIDKGSISKTTEHEVERKIYAEIVRGSPKKEEGKKIQEEEQRETTPPRIFKTIRQPAMERPQEE